MHFSSPIVDDAQNHLAFSTVVCCAEVTREYLLRVTGALCVGR